MVITYNKSNYLFTQSKYLCFILGNTFYQKVECQNTFIQISHQYSLTFSKFQTESISIPIKSVYCIINMLSIERSEIFFILFSKIPSSFIFLRASWFNCIQTHSILDRVTHQNQYF